MDRFVGVLYVSRLLAIAALVSVLLSPARAQILAVGDDTSTPIEGVGHDYIKLLSEIVSPANGSVSVRIQTSPPKARGITLPFSFSYDSNGVNHLYPANSAGPISDETVISQGGWSYGLPLLQMTSWSTETPGGVSCSFSSGYTFQDPSGGRHNLGLGTTSWSTGGNQGEYLCDPAVTSGGDQKYAASLLNDANGGVVNPPVVVSDDDGTVYYFPNPELYADANIPGFSSPPSYIEDRNGNKISLTSQSNGSFTVADTTGRAAVTSNGLGASGTTNTISVSGMSYQVNWTSTTPSFSFPHEMLYTVDQYQCDWGSASTAETVVNSITLPNTKLYKFQYGSNPNAPNEYGLLSEIDYPTGAWVRYTWKMSDTYSEAAVWTAVGGPGGATYSEGCVALIQTPVIATRSVGVSGSSTPIQTQTFTYNTTWNTQSDTNPYWTAKTTEVVTTDNVRGLTSETLYGYIPGYAGYNNVYNIDSWIASQLPLESAIQYYNWGAQGSGKPGSLMRTVNKTWHDNFDMASEETVLNDDNSLTSEVTYQYTSTNPTEVTNKSEYDYGLTLLRSTTTSYQAFATTPVGGLITDKPCQTITYDGNNNQYAETNYLYDNGTAQCGADGTPSVTGVTGLVAGTHDETNYGPTSSTSRGNLTQKTEWESTGTSPVTTYTYDETGQVLTMLDACGNGSCSDMTGSTHTTTYSYADNYTVLSGGQNIPYTPSGVTNTYLTTVTNALRQSDTFSYDYNNGQLTTSTDPNSKSMGYIYNDSLARPTQISYPDGGQTGLTYNDAAYNPSTPSPSVTTTILIASGVNEISTAAVDYLGRPVETILSSDPDGITYAATTYDGMNKVYTVSNPYRTTSDPTYGITTYTYDALGRTTQVAKPDGSVVSTVYTGTQTTGAVTTVTDETGNQRTNQTDGLGRLTFVWEAPNNSNYNYQTAYTYNPLNDLLSVNQNGSRARTFTYDSLSRLLCAANPEIQIVTCPTSATGTFPAGAITYSYDLNGNLSSRVAPKPGATSGTTIVTTNYSYDALNRLTQKAYVDISTPKAQYGYDGTALSSCGETPPTISSPTNLIGRRSSMCAGSSSSSWSYDPMGRPLIESRLNHGSAQKTLNVSYSYYKDGSLNTVTYPSGDLLTYTVGGAGRPTQLSDSMSGSSTNYVGYAGNTATYAPQGALATMTNGYSSAFAGITTSNVYNLRLQPLLLSASVSQSAKFSLCYNFNLGVAVSVSNTTCSFNASSSGDNGNVFQILNGVDSTRSSAYLYDPLNRIAQAYTLNLTSSNCWGETYSPTETAPGVLPSTPGIDAWGNLINRSGVSGMSGNCATEGLSQTANNRNQLSAVSYDIAGNVLNDGNGNTPTYDGENRIVTDAGVTYSYDADSVRIEKSSGTMYWPGPSGTLAETNLAGTINEEYIFFKGQRIARVDRPSGTVHYYFSNHLGSHSMVTSATGSCEQDIDYFPYGGIIVDHCPNVAQHYRFTGKERDSESGLDNFGARYNASSMGRFMTPDPSNLSVDFWLPQTWNRYAYALNNPLAVVDRNGLWPWYIHNEIIDEAFPGLSKSQLQSLKTASANVDKDQSPAGSYKHGMGNGDAVNNTTTPGDTSDYIHQNEQTAEQVQADWIASGHTGIAPGAMTAFGNALHTVTDMTSPAHEGYQLWYGTWDFFGVTAAYHFLSESRISDARRNTAIAAARQTFMNTFGWMALQNATDGLTPKVTHKICYPDENGKQSCQ